MGVNDEVVREATFFREVMDPFVRAVRDAEDPWQAYESVASMRSAMIDFLDWGPHGGAVFAAWADLEDLYDTGKTPIPDAHAALRQAASDWLARPSVPNDMAAYIESWVAHSGPYRLGDHRSRRRLLDLPFVDLETHAFCRGQ